MDKALTNIWAKTAKSGVPTWHPLILHMLDVGASADAILAREPETTRKRIAKILGLEWDLARAWILLLVACHDLGKASPGFQCKWENMTGMDSGRSPNTDINHAFVSQIALTELLQEKGWPDELSELVADAVGCHHGERAAPTTLDRLMGDRRAIGSDDWAQARRGLVEALLGVLKPAKIPTKRTLDGPDFMLLSGLTSFADWIGSNEDRFPFGSPEDCEDLPEWFQKRRGVADQALDAIAWAPRTPLSSEPKSFEQVFGFAPRPVQQAVADALVNLKEPAILLVEAPMGEGKTEAALFAHLELQRRFGHRGLYVALPTKATGNAMFKRTLRFLCSQGTERKLDLQLLHGAALLSETFQNLRLSGIHDPTTGGEVRAGEWFTNKKRALLSEYGVGTVDQALLTILPVRHNFVRLWGLANRVVVFDEIHAYDAYTGTLLVHLLRWLVALGSSVVLLSATLSPSIRRKLAAVVDADLPVQEAEYPRLSVFRPGAVEQKHFEAPIPHAAGLCGCKRFRPTCLACALLWKNILPVAGWDWGWSIRCSEPKTCTDFFPRVNLWSAKASASANSCPMERKCCSFTRAFRPTGGRNARIMSWKPSERVAIGLAGKSSLPPKWRSRAWIWTSI